MDTLLQNLTYLAVILTFCFIGVVNSRASHFNDDRHHKETTTSDYDIVSSHALKTANPERNETQSITTHQPTGSSDVNSSPCTLKEDRIPHGGALVNCSDRGLTKIQRDWFPANTTTIILDHNNISTLYNNTFSHLKELRNLSISTSNVSMIEVDALKGLDRLITLNLENNNLSLTKYAFPRGMFRHTPDILQLFIAYNKRENMTASNYSTYIDIFDYLPKLQSLSIDAFVKLHLGYEFESFQNLSSLVLFCGSTHKVSNESFVGLANISLKHLEMREFLNEPFYFHFLDKSIHFEEDALQYLTHLDSLTIYVCPVGNKKMLKILQQLQNRNMTSIILDGTGSPLHYLPPDEVMKDGIILKADTEQINNLCMSNFAWRNSQIFAISPDALYNTGMMRCIKTLDLSSNPLQLVGYLSEIYVLSVFPRLETLILTMPQEVPKPSKDNGILPPFNQPKQSVLWDSDQRSRMNEMYSNYNDNEDLSRGRSFHNQTVSRTLSHQARHEYRRTDVSHISGMQPIYPFITIYLPPKLTTLRLDGYSQRSFLHIWSTIHIANAENFTGIYAANMPGFINGPGRLTGVNNVKIIVISSSLLDVGEYFMDDFSGLENLTMSDVKPDNFFQRISCKRLLHNMRKLIYLDISNNGLNWFLPETFSSTPNLSYLSLANNRFSEIPFDLSSTPKLEVLDLSDNAILYLTAVEMTAIDNHLHGVQRFLLKLHGNKITCVCSQTKFLAWQQTTMAKLDDDGNYICTDQDGHQTYTGDIGRDLEGFWRECQGEFMLMVSLVLMSLMTVTILITYLMGRFRTALVAFVLKIVAPTFRPLTPSDYRTDVFIGYADDDVLFVRNVINRYLEEELHMRTFVHHRDFRLGYEGEQFFHAIQNSWRVLIVITETFLHQYNMADLVMKFASLSVSPVNQGRVFVLAEESQLHAIPDYLHDVLDDTRIIVLHDLNQSLSYEQTQSIKTCLLPVP